MHLTCLQVFAMPMFDMIETYAVKSIKLKPSTFLRFAVRTTYVGKCNWVSHNFNCSYLKVDEWGVSGQYSLNYLFLS